MKAKVSTFLIFFSLIFVIPMFSQNSVDAIEDVILLNNKPYLVRMAQSGKILSFVKDLKDSDITSFDVKKNVIKLADVIEVEGEDIATIEEPFISEDVTSKAPVEKKVKYDYEFAFDHRDSRLSIVSVSRLKQIADIIKSNNNVKFYINSYYAESVDVSKIMSKNRTNAMVELLVARGIDKSRIEITQTNHDDWGNNRIKASIY